eukprot:1145335-Pelagomonas_calceolata.AAC.4
MGWGCPQFVTSALAFIFDLPHFLSSCWLWFHGRGNPTKYHRLTENGEGAGAPTVYKPPLPLGRGVLEAKWKPPVQPKDANGKIDFGLSLPPNPTVTVPKKTPQLGSTCSSQSQQPNPLSQDDAPSTSKVFLCICSYVQRPQATSVLNCVTWTNEDVHSSCSYCCAWLNQHNSVMIYGMESTSSFAGGRRHKETRSAQKTYTFINSGNACKTVKLVGNRHTAWERWPLTCMCTFSSATWVAHIYVLAHTRTYTHTGGYRHAAWAPPGRG